MRVFIKLLPSESGSYVEEETERLQKPVEMEDTKETAGPMHAGTHRDQGRMHRARPEGVPAQDTSSHP